MKKYLSYIVALTIILIGLSSCHTSAPRLDYKALAQASVRLGVDIELQDNHKLYIHASEWIGTPYRAGGDSKRGTDCSGLVSQLYKKVYHTRLSRSTDGQLKESSKISRRNLREGDLVFFTSRASRKKVAHVGIYLKDGKFIHASTSQGVIVSNLREKYYTQHWLCGGRIKYACDNLSLLLNKEFALGTYTKIRSLHNASAATLNSCTGSLLLLEY